MKLQFKFGQRAGIPFISISTYGDYASEYKNSRVTGSNMIDLP